MSVETPTTITPEIARRHVAGYIVVVIALVAAIMGAMVFFRGWIDRHQRSLPRYAAERAIEALDRGDFKAAAAEVDFVLKDRPLRSGGLLNQRVNELWEGPVYRNRVTTYEQLCARLLKAGMIEQARAVAEKTLLEYHISSRSLELIVPWEMEALAAGAGKDWFTMFQSAKILAAHGAEMLRTPGRMNPFPFPENAEMFKEIETILPAETIMGMKMYYEGPSTEIEWGHVYNQLARARGRIANAAMQDQIDRVLHQAYLDGGKPDLARQILAGKPGSDAREPRLMDYLWSGRPAGTKLSPADFIDSFASDPRVQVVDLSKLETLDFGFFHENNKVVHDGRAVDLPNNVAGSMEIDVKAEADRVAIAYEGLGAVKIQPIVLIRVDAGRFVPVYCDSMTPSIIMADVNIPAGKHTLTLVFLNDGMFSFPASQIEENRSLRLERVALIQSKRG